MATPEQARMADSLGTRFRDLAKLVNELNVEASLYQTSLQIKNDETRLLFQSLTRITAVADQVELSLNLMRDDISAVEASSLDSASALWRECLQEALEEHSCTVSMFTSKVH